MPYIPHFLLLLRRLLLKHRIEISIALFLLCLYAVAWEQYYPGVLVVRQQVKLKILCDLIQGIRDSICLF